MTATRSESDSCNTATCAPEAAVPLDKELSAAIRDLGDLPPLAQQLLNQSPIQVLVFDRELKIRWANPTFSRFRKVPPEQIIGRPAEDFFGNLSAHSARFGRAFGGEVTQFLMSTRPLSDGVSYDLNIQLRPVRDRAGHVPALCVFVGDLGFQRLGDDSLPSTAQAMRQVLGSLPDLVLVLDHDLHVLFANRGIAQHTAEQLEGLHVSEFMPLHLHDVAVDAMRRTLATGQVDGYTGEIEEADGQTRHFEVRVSAIRRGPKIVGLTLNASETTEQVRAERAIATQARMIDSMLEGVAVIDANGVIDITNPAFDAMFGYNRGELAGREMNSLAGWPFGQRERWQLVASGESTELEFDGRKRDGRHFSAAGVLSGFDIAGRNHSLLVLQDVSERKQLERAILQAVNREQYRIGNDLHDGLGQELTGIALMLRGVAGRLTAEYPPILPEIEGITRLVSSAIESTRALARGLSPVNLERGGLQDALEGLAMHASELYGVPTVFTHRLTGNRSLNAELANHLYRIAQEAVRNAVRHGHARSIRLHLSSARAKVRLAITDDGVGMPEGAMDAVGMGLKIMCYRARILGGEVSFEPAEPNGTRVVCECPFEAASGSQRARGPQKRRARAG